MRGESEPVPAFFEAAFHRAEPDIQSIRARLPSFPSPPLRVQRVGQLDADLLDQELADLLAEPVKAALRNVSPTLDKRRHDEIYLFLRLILYKFSIFDRSASYGAMLQNLKYRNEWAHRAHCTYALYLRSTIDRRGCASLTDSAGAVPADHDHCAVCLLQGASTHDRAPL